MKNFQKSILIVTLLVSAVTLAGENKKEKKAKKNYTESLSYQIGDMLNRHYYGNSKAVATVKFHITENSEIEVLLVDCNFSGTEEFIMETLNNQKVDVDSLNPNKVYRIKVVMQ